MIDIETDGGPNRLIGWLTAALNSSQQPEAGILANDCLPLSVHGLCARDLLDFSTASSLFLLQPPPLVDTEHLCLLRSLLSIVLHFHEARCLAKPEPLPVGPFPEPRTTFYASTGSSSRTGLTAINSDKDDWRIRQLVSASFMLNIGTVANAFSYVRIVLCIWLCIVEKP